MLISSTQVAQSVPFDSTATPLTSDNVQAAILEVLSKVAAVTFSYKLIVSSETVTIPVNREMVVNNDITIDGVLIIEGDLSIV